MMMGQRSRIVSLLPWLAGAAWLAGSVWRYRHLFNAHPMTGFVYSDMAICRNAALAFFDGQRVPNIADNLYPPGAGSSPAPSTPSIPVGTSPPGSCGCSPAQPRCSER
jgi:hypothetical protein